MIAQPLPTVTDDAHCPTCGASVDGWQDFFCPNCGAAQYPDPFAAIFAAPIPTPRAAKLRTRPTKEIAAEARKLLKELGIGSLSVTAPRRSSHVTIRLPRIAHEHDHSRPVSHCPPCTRANNARDRIERILVSAFPDTEDRSDIMSDYFNFVWLVS